MDPGDACYLLLNGMISLTERSEVREIGTGTLNERSEFSVIVSEVREIGTGLLNDMLSLTERSEVRDSGTGPLNEHVSASLVAS